MSICLAVVVFLFIFFLITHFQKYNTILFSYISIYMGLYTEKNNKYMYFGNNYNEIIEMYIIFLHKNNCYGLIFHYLHFFC